MRNGPAGFFRRMMVQRQVSIFWQVSIRTRAPGVCTRALSGKNVAPKLAETKSNLVYLAQSAPQCEGRRYPRSMNAGSDAGPGIGRRQHV